MPKLRDDLLRKLPPDDQELMKRFRRRPLKAYTLQELLPTNQPSVQSIVSVFLLDLRLEALISQGLVMKLVSEGEVYYAKASRPKRTDRAR